MDFVDEQHVVGLKIGEERCQILGLFQHRAAGLPQIHTQFVRDDMGKCGLAKTWRTKQQHMIQRLTAFFGSADENFQLPAHFFLAHVFIQQFGAQRALQRLFLRVDGCTGDCARRGRRRGLGMERVGLDGHGKK